LQPLEDVLLLITSQSGASQVTPYDIFASSIKSLLFISWSAPLHSKSRTWSSTGFTWCSNMAAVVPLENGVIGSRHYLNSLVTIVSSEIWKEWNYHIFNQRSPATWVSIRSLKLLQNGV
jgi:hypothetical protein